MAVTNRIWLTCLQAPRRFRRWKIRASTYRDFRVLAYGSAIGQFEHASQNFCTCGGNVRLCSLADSSDGTRLRVDLDPGGRPGGDYPDDDVGEDRDNKDDGDEQVD